MDLNLLERGLAAAFPEWGLRRLHAKASLEQARMSARAYDAARRDRRTEGWRVTGSSANAELAPALKTIVARSRDLCRNNEWAINGKRKWKAHLIGPGIVPRAAVKGKRAKQVAQDAFNAFADNCDPEGLTDYYGIQASLIGEVFEGGAAFLRWYPRPSDMGLKVPLQCEVLEHDFLDTTKTEILDNGRGNVVIHGVEYDSYGRRVAYWLFPTHPGEVSMIRRANFKSERVPAEFCDHVFRVDRAGQVTGVPWLASSMLRFRDVADAEEADLVRRKIAACFTVFVRRGGTAMTGVAQAADQSSDNKNRRIEKISPGMIAYVEGEGDITPAKPPEAPDDGNMERQQYAFAAGIGLPFATLTGNLRNVNFTSMREGKIDFWAGLDQIQWHMAVPQICRPAWGRVMRAAAARGLQVSPDTPAKHAMPKRPWVNPADDLKAAAGELALGLESWAEMVAARGYDPEELLAEIKEWLPKLKEAGLNPAAAPGLAGLSGGAPGDKGGQDPAKPKDVVTSEENDQ
ncbi:phage portal protein [Bradyrhizobium sp. Arg237L]|uniref:phage portal protein n=1 Tax=Bradyrhizobium sp. Arg237L TaxID=3003352 RepID=UPI00249DDBAC|nr:phage portal protein [Bradyrhizobium sp. Arg237L]MDI4231438.1 phage portal protein [Bradyrhizobium sp. Arg237L]